MGKFASDFKAFIAKGNVVDMAVGVVVGGAFNKIVTSLVNDIIMPLVSLLAGGLNVSDWKWVIRPAETAADGTQIAENALMYGNFIQTVLDFLIVAFTIFVVLRVFTKLQAAHAESAKEKRRVKVSENTGVLFFHVRFAGAYEAEKFSELLLIDGAGACGR